jgi:hypothetical protein
VGSVQGVPRHQRLATVGGVCGRRCELGLGNTHVVSVESRFGREPMVFREGAVVPVRGMVVTMCHGARRCWHSDGLSMPCRSAWRGELGEA